LDFFRKYHRRIRGIHVSNFNGRCHSPLNEGVIDFKEFFALLKEYNYEGTVTLELDKQEATVIQDNINLIKSYE
jgi:sugar phosphate isomerase/epimerase